MSSDIGKRIRVGVDVGGTFTDFVLVDEKRDLIFTGKRLTTPEDPSLAITDGLERLVSESGTSVPELDAVVHGTTLVANTIIERKGAKVGLITTKGSGTLSRWGARFAMTSTICFSRSPNRSHLVSFGSRWTSGSTRKEMS